MGCGSAGSLTFPPTGAGGLARLGSRWRPRVRSLADEITAAATIVGRIGRRGSSARGARKKLGACACGGCDGWRRGPGGGLAGGEAAAEPPFCSPAPSMGTARRPAISVSQRTPRNERSNLLTSRPAFRSDTPTSEPQRLIARSCRGPPLRRPATLERTSLIAGCANPLLFPTAPRSDPTAAMESHK